MSDWVADDETGGTSNEAMLIVPGISFVLPSWSPPTHPFEALQRFSGRVDEDKFSFEAQVSYNNERLHVVALDMLGRRAFDLTWSPKGISAEQAEWMPIKINPKRILTDIVMLYWPLEVVEAGTRGAAAMWEERGAARRLKSDNNTVLLVYPITEKGATWGKDASLTNYALNYKIEIKTQEFSQ